MIVVYIVFFIFKSREHFLSACVHCELANVAFTLGQTNHLYLSHGEQLTYNKIITNLLAQFDSRGSFVSRKPGLYAFHFFSLAHNRSRTWIELFKNTNYVCSIFGYTSHGYADAGNSVFLHLNEYDTVSIKSHRSYNTTLYGTGDQIYTTFTGVLLNPDEAGTNLKCNLQNCIEQIQKL